MRAKGEVLVLHIPKRIFLGLLAVVAVLGGGATIFFLLNRSTGYLPYPISKSTAQSLGYNIYYPSQKLLPKGYTLNKNSFDATSEALIYSVNYANNKRFVFSIQQKPTSSQISQFYSQNMPLHTNQSTKIGTATIGAIKGQTVISLPTITNAWILITAPGSATPQQISPLLKSLEIAK